MLTAERLHRQGELVDRLAKLGIHATQATLSRDLAELRVVKGADGYQMPLGDAVDAQPADPLRTLAGALSRLLLEASVGGSLIVLHTPTGQAAPLALEIDRASPHGVLGTIAGDDCVFVATASPSKARTVANAFRSLSADPSASKKSSGLTAMFGTR